MPRHLASVPLAACLLAVFACAGPGGSSDQDAAESLAGTEWRLVAIPGLPEPAAAWIEFEPGGGAGGNAGCNHFGGDYEQDGARLVFRDIFSTMMACVDETRMETEARFLSALRAARRVVATGDRIELRGEDGEVVAVLAPRGA